MAAADEELNDCAALTLQCWWRGITTRKAIEKSCARRSLLLHLNDLDEEHAFEVVDRTAVRLQSWARRCFAVRRAKMQQSLNSRAEFVAELEERCAFERHAASRLQRWIRGIEVPRHVEGLHEERRSQEEKDIEEERLAFAHITSRNSALLLQRAARGWTARKQLAACRSCPQLGTACGSPMRELHAGTPLDATPQKHTACQTKNEHKKAAAPPPRHGKMKLTNLPPVRPPPRKRQPTALLSKLPNLWDSKFGGSKIAALYALARKDRLKDLTVDEVDILHRIVEHEIESTVRPRNGPFKSPRPRALLPPIR